MYMRKIKLVIILVLTFTMSLGVNVYSSQIEKTFPIYPTDIAVGDGFYVITSKTYNCATVYNTEDNSVKNTIQFNLPVTGIYIDGIIGYVTHSYDKGFLSKVDLSSGEIIKTVEAGMGAKSPILSNDKKVLYVCNQFEGTVQSFNAETLNVKEEVAVLREPFKATISKDDKYLFVNNFLPVQRADGDYVAADVSVIDLSSMQRIKDIKLDNGSNALRDITISNDGKYVMVTHNLGRFQVPTSQLQQGWMNTSAVSVIDVASQSFLGSIIFDEPDRGAAGIWGIDMDENKIIVSHSGTHDISIIDYNVFKDKFEKIPEAKRANLSYDLYFLYGIRKRLPIVGNGPRNIKIKDGLVYVPTYFSDTLNVVNIDTQNIESIALNPNREMSIINLGEEFFNDATYCFQNWQSCNGCHPGDGRTDAMNWDLMNDGVGNSKNCKSLLLSHITNPSMITGIRATAELAVRAGFQHIQFAKVDESKALAVDEYLKSLKPLPSPYLVDGELSELAIKGRDVFEKQDCGSCHSGPQFTDRKMYRIGEDVEFEKGWDTPTLVEVWRTAPYLFDGRAETIEEVFEVHKHGIKKKLNKKDAAALAEYVKSI